jgi:hypothetical protein
LTPSDADHRSGALDTVATPFERGPRQCGQSCASSAGPTARKTDKGYEGAHHGGIPQADK